MTLGTELHSISPRSGRFLRPRAPVYFCPRPMLALCGRGWTSPGDGADFFGSMKNRREWLQGKAVEQSGGILSRQVVCVLDDMIVGKRDFSFLPWRMISFGAWMERFDIRTE